MSNSDKLRTILIDDEPIALTKLKKYSEKIKSLEVVGEFASSTEAADFLDENDVDLIITDIAMPDLSGMELAEKVENRSLIIFTTAYADYAVESYKVSAVDYLLKPFTFKDFRAAVKKAEEIYSHFLLPVYGSGTQPALTDRIFVKVDSKFMPVKFDDIIYIKGFSEYLKVFVVGRATPLVTLASFSSVLQLLPPSFRQIHRSYVINLNHVLYIERNRLVLEGDVSIVVSESYRPEFSRLLSSLTLGKR